MKAEQNWTSFEDQLQFNKLICYSFELECLHRVPNTIFRLFNLIAIWILIKTFNWFWINDKFIWFIRYKTLNNFRYAMMIQMDRFMANVVYDGVYLRVRTNS
jgi:hypothetical protein